ncbi:hypothetical protein C8R47DRAFT_1172014 [Mycena vitilis]|nr:hypothetical protein C8R47DRAFT_1172014 [Mycena vitilis]
MSIMDRVPEEVLDNIIRLAARQGQLEMFYDLRRISHSQTSSNSTASSCVAVSHKWQRVTTPILYSAIVLGSKAQALALVQTLRNFPDVRLFVKKLYVQGGLGKEIKTILALTSQLDTIGLTLNLPATASVVGLLKGLPLINPRHLIVHDHPGDKYKRMLGPKEIPFLKVEASLVKAIGECMQGPWQQLEAAWLSIPDDSKRYSWCKQLNFASSLQEIHIPPYARGVPEFIHDFVDNANVKRIVVEETESRVARKFRRGVEKEGKLSVIVQYIS